MNRHYYLLFFLALLTIGLIAVQLYWIQKSTQLNRDQFDKSVYFSLQSLSRKMEAREAYGFIEKKVNINTEISSSDQENKNRPLLGAFVINIDPETAADLDLKSTYGVYVSDVVKGSPAFFAGINSGDIITEINERPVNNISEMRARMAHFKAGDRIGITYERPQKNFAKNDEIERLSSKAMLPADTLLVRVETSLKGKLAQHSDSCLLEVILDKTNSAKQIILHNGEGKNASYFATIYKLDAQEEPTPSASNISPEESDSLYRIIEQALIDTAARYAPEGSAASSGNRSSQTHWQLDSTIQFIRQIVARMASRKDLEDKIALYNIDAMLKEELKLRGIEITPEWAVTNLDNDIIKCSRDFNEQEHLTSYQTDLFPSNPLDEPSFLHAYFPEKEKYLVRHNIFIPLSAFFFILGILSVFFFTYRNLIKQTKISDLKTDFINNMTHELKTPVSTIKLASEMLLDSSMGANEDRRNRYMHIIQEENSRLSTQIEKVLQIARIEKGELELQREKLNLHELLEEAITHIILHLELKEGRIERHYDLNNPWIFADPVHLKNVFVNLLDNAIKYTPAKPLIMVSTGDVNDELVVKIADNGIGISKEAQKKIFDKFYRVPTGNLHDVKGFGLGLSYVKFMIEAHGGHIQVTSKPNEGSLFEMFFPEKKEWTMAT